MLFELMKIKITKKDNFVHNFSLKRKKFIFSFHQIIFLVLFLTFDELSLFFVIIKQFYFLFWYESFFNSKNVFYVFCFNLRIIESFIFYLFEEIFHIFIIFFSLKYPFWKINFPKNFYQIRNYVQILSYIFTKSHSK